MFDPRLENAKQMARRRFEAKERLERIKSRTPCAHCGHTYHHSQVDVVRREGRRRIPLSRMLHLSWQRIAEELERGEIVCSNCSRLIVWMKDRQRRSGPT